MIGDSGEFEGGHSWNVGILEYWDTWNTGIWEYGNMGILEINTGILEYWNT